MVNKSVVYGCTSEYKTNKDKISSFEFLIYEKLDCFCKSTCIKYLKDDFINFGKINTLK